jgi:hypothetical protein
LLRRLDLGSQRTNVCAFLGQIALPVAALLDGNFDPEGAFDLLAEGSEIEQPPFRELARELRALGRREVGKNTMADSGLITRTLLRGGAAGPAEL